MLWIGIVFFKEKISKIVFSNCFLLSSENEKKNLLRNCIIGVKKVVVMFNFFKMLIVYLIWVFYFGLR